MAKGGPVEGLNPGLVSWKPKGCPHAASTAAGGGAHLSRLPRDDAARPSMQHAEYEQELRRAPNTVSAFVPMVLLSYTVDLEHWH
ncbi:hypothetical protein GOP47_0020492 [Adiantum capillus-veneris]|uniref:Uncharacterized protein n=1 Tax=Adiantum capillus-veneris TaxID=13818 RepID=A0A9D4UA32_ADICA|nr:hypothetical protein GOP47_0020492 [Adiantum capillus-veneris]